MTPMAGTPDPCDIDAPAAATGFLVALAHDVRGPIAALMHQVELLTTDELSPALRRRSVEAAEVHAAELGWLLETLDDVERYVLGEIDVRPTGTDSTALLHEIAGSATAVIAPPDAIDLVVDPALVRRIVRLLVQSVASRGGERRIELRAAEGGVELAVGAAVADPVVVLADHELDVHLRLAAALASLHGGRLEVGRRGSAPVAVLHLPVEGP
jgi:K+-sensing histidine kinase KdpD